MSTLDPPPAAAPPADPETVRLAEDAKREKNWKRWGTYLSERQWGTVREDYSADGNAWDYLPHDHARSRAYRWGDRLSPGSSRPPPWRSASTSRRYWAATCKSSASTTSSPVPGGAPTGSKLTVERSRRRGIAFRRLFPAQGC